MKRIAILGSTGSIGRQALEVIKKLPDKFKAVALTCDTNSNLLSKQIKQFRPALFSSNEAKNTSYTAKYLPIEDIVSHPDIDLVIVATSGKAGLLPTLQAIRAGKQIALANKEILVMAGDIITKEANKFKIEIRPIDSEHSAVWQCLQGENNPPNRIILTASGGPFYDYSQQQLSDITPEKALNHPTWKMGKKVTIDSATLVNKGLEAIEAQWLFNISLDSIKIVIHRQSIVHSLVEFYDGSVKAQMSLPDMRLPIQYALTYPERLANTDLPSLDLLKIKALTFEPVNHMQFPSLKLVLEAGEKGGTYPAVLSATDEVAVNLFLNGQIGFRNIPELISETLNIHESIDNPSLEDILSADKWARDVSMCLAGKRVFH